MHAKSLQKLVLLAALTRALPGAPVVAPPAPMAWSLGYSCFKLRPDSGTNERMNGFALGGEYPQDPFWSLEASVSRQTGTEADTVALRQMGALAGVKTTSPLGDRARGFVHLLAGWEQLHASQGDQADQRASLAFGPGIGLDVALTRNVSARGQVDFLFTHYSGVVQGSPALFVGLVYRR